MGCAFWRGTQEGFLGLYSRFELNYHSLRILPLYQYLLSKLSPRPDRNPKRASEQGSFEVSRRVSFLGTSSDFFRLAYERKGFQLEEAFGACCPPREWRRGTRKHKYFARRTCHRAGHARSNWSMPETRSRGGIDANFILRSIYLYIFIFVGVTRMWLTS